MSNSGKEPIDLLDPSVGNTEQQVDNTMSVRGLRKDLSFLYGTVDDEPTIDPDSINTIQEQKILHKTLKIRETIVDNKLAIDGLPTKSGDMRVINEMLSAMDTSVHTGANNRLKQQSNDKDNDFILDLAAKVINGINSKTGTYVGKINGKLPERDLSDEFIPVDVVPDEMTIGISSITEEDIK